MWTVIKFDKKQFHFFKNELKNKINFIVTKKLESTIPQVLKDIKSHNLLENIVLLSPCAASFDQFRNFEERGNEFKKIINNYYA